jgi:hypothetical protein
VTAPAPALCACGQPRGRGFSRCEACRQAAIAADPLRNLDHALLYQLRTRNRACDCRCPADHHDRHGCRLCGTRCEVAYQDHGDREAHEQLDDWLTAGLAAGDPLALWVEGWRREDPPADQRRPEAAAGELGSAPLDPRRCDTVAPCRP